ncbi:MAG: hypothetical protein AAF499_09600, partial [Pseudomonadota bacterium]
ALEHSAHAELCGGERLVAGGSVSDGLMAFGIHAGLQYNVKAMTLQHLYNRNKASQLLKSGCLFGTRIFSR